MTHITADEQTTTTTTTTCDAVAAAPPAAVREADAAAADAARVATETTSGVPTTLDTMDTAASYVSDVTSEAPSSLETDSEFGESLASSSLLYSERDASSASYAVTLHLARASFRPGEALRVGVEFQRTSDVRDWAAQDAQQQQRGGFPSAMGIGCAMTQASPTAPSSKTGRVVLSSLPDNKKIAEKIVLCSAGDDMGYADFPENSVPTVSGWCQLESYGLASASVPCAKEVVLFLENGDPDHLERIDKFLGDYRGVGALGAGEDDEDEYVLPVTLELDAEQQADLVAQVKLGERRVNDVIECSKKVIEQLASRAAAADAAAATTQQAAAQAGADDVSQQSVERLQAENLALKRANQVLVQQVSLESDAIKNAVTLKHENDVLTERLAQFAILQQAHDDIQLRNLLLQQEVRRYELSHEDLKSRLDDADRDVQAMKAKVGTLTQEWRAASDELTQSERETKHAKDELTQLKLDAAQAKQEQLDMLGRHQMELQQLKQDVAQHKQEAAQHKQDNLDLLSRHQVALTKSERETKLFKDELTHHKQDAAQAKQDRLVMLSRHQAELQQLKQDTALAKQEQLDMLSRHQVELQQAVSRQQGAEARAVAALEGEAALRATLEKERHERASLPLAKEVELSQTIAELRKDLATRANSAAALEARCMALQESSDKMAGYARQFEQEATASRALITTLEDDMGSRHARIAELTVHLEESERKHLVRIEQLEQANSNLEAALALEQARKFSNPDIEDIKNLLGTTSAEAAQYLQRFNGDLVATRTAIAREKFGHL
ncbi:hypothetical protein CAOG_06201 [Capsaspora owczarzaki ATCC 30864]|uniref:hypothetical protein n=1 Tax=Capsaspora owczarzaki (strain ATCC 30864) TaxID=595528 RepID=UPI00035248B2|nr:hypothetical protein CAOG_06201 [Capsaspora owczarzaki ATCC 30864]|eukprot:XP_004345791.2 hypothetical protein CAOG_06201 [Capsaspora owczarzaki ATCC 30864]